MDLRKTFVLANEFKEGDVAVGGTDDPHLRAEARRALASVRIGEIVPSSLIDDGVSGALERSLDTRLASDVSTLTIAGLKQILLSPDSTAWIRRYRDGLRSEAIAAVVKVMTGDELATVARSIFNPLPGQGITVGARGHFGSRIQPNSPGDDDEEILLSILEGLTYGCGDVILGLNPASDDVDTIVRLEDLLRGVAERLRLPTRYCVLSDIVKQTRARERTRVDVGFQSLAGTSKALAGMVGLDVDGILDLARGFGGCYFETGQGSAVTNGTADNVDMVTLESRAYGVARCIQRATGAWTIVNDVAGFIGPEVFRTAAQLERACLEDIVMAKLHGLTMGLDVCATFHMGIAPEALHETTRRVVERGAPAYLMAVAGNADPMLGYLTTSFREHPQLRRRSGCDITSAMSERLAALDADSTSSLYAVYMKEGGDRRTTDALRDEASTTIERLRARGYDLGYGHEPDYTAPAHVRTRLDNIYDQARRALYASVDAHVVDAVSPRHVRVRTRSRDRDDYLAHPPSGEFIRDEDARRIASAVAGRGGRRPQVQVVLSDGLNANALNENVRAVLPPLRRELSSAGLHVGDVDVVIENGRVRAGYHVGGIVDADAIAHFIGERPGTGLDTMSAYLTYGRDAAGQSRWSSDLDHSATTAVCGIHRDAKPPAQAVSEIARLLTRILSSRRSGVSLCALVMLAASARGASAEWTVALLAGGAHTQQSSITLVQPDESTNLTISPVAYRSESFEPPFYYGYRVGFLPHARWLGLEGEFIHLKVIADTARQATVDGALRGERISRPQPIAAVVERFSISHGVNLVLVNAVIRHSANDDEPSPRWFAAARLGAGGSVPHPESTIGGASLEQYEWGSLSVQAAAGVEVRLWPHVYLAGEYKLTRSVQDVGVAGGSVRTLLTSHHLVTGVVAHLGAPH